MGKQQKASKGTFLTQREHTESSAGFDEKRLDAEQHQRLPFNHCQLSLQPTQHPVAVIDNQSITDQHKTSSTASSQQFKPAFVFDLLNIVPYITEHHANPLNNEALELKQLIRLHWHIDESTPTAQSAISCMATFKPFTEHSHIIALATTGNVYHFSALNEMALKHKSYFDLIDDSPFKLSDVIVIQDPLSTHHQRLNQKLQPIRKISQSSSNKLAIDSLSAEDAQIVAKLKGSSSSSSSSSSSTTNNSTTTPTTAAQSKPLSMIATTAAPAPSSQLQHANAIIARAKYSSGLASGSATSTGVTLTTRNDRLALTPRQRRLQQYDFIRRHHADRKDYVRLSTTFGDLNLELHSGLTPETCDNFIRHCRSSYYVNTICHRLIPQFILQFGDPTSTGYGGDSAFMKDDARDYQFNDEIRLPILRHDRRGVLSSANDGSSNSNASQFFLLFEPKPHLDGKHTVFGRLIGGMSVLDMMEKQSTDSTNDRPLKDIRITATRVLDSIFDQEFLVKDAVTGKSEAQSSLSSSTTSSLSNSNRKKRPFDSVAETSTSSSSSSSTFIPKRFKP